MVKHGVEISQWVLFTLIFFEQTKANINAKKLFPQGKNCIQSTIYILEQKSTNLCKKGEQQFSVTTIYCAWSNIYAPSKAAAIIWIMWPPHDLICHNWTDCVRRRLQRSGHRLLAACGTNNHNKRLSSFPPSHDESRTQQKFASWFRLQLRCRRDDVRARLLTESYGHVKWRFRHVSSMTWDDTRDTLSTMAGASGWWVIYDMWYMASSICPGGCVSGVSIFGMVWERDVLEQFSNGQ